MNCYSDPPRVNHVRLAGSELANDRFKSTTLTFLIKTLLRSPYFYLQRLRFWQMVARDTEAVDEAGRKVLRKSMFAAPFTALRNLGKWENPRLLGDARLRVKDYGLFDCRAETDDLFHVLPEAQPGVRRAIEKYLSPGDTFVDAGANIGFFTVVGANIVGPRGKVIAVEMIPETAQALRAHIAMNHLENVTVIEQALADTSGEEIIAHLPSDHVGQATLLSETLRGSSTREIRVTTTTLDFIIGDSKKIDLMKIDLEGAEALALKGGESMLALTKRVVFEARPQDKGARATVEALKAAGFEISQIDKYNKLAERA